MASKALVIQYKTKIRTFADADGTEYIEFKRKLSRADAFTPDGDKLRPMRPADHDYYNSDLFPGVLQKFAERITGGRSWCRVAELPDGITIERGAFLSLVTYQEPTTPERDAYYNTANFPHFVCNHGNWDIYSNAAGYCAAIPAATAPKGCRASHFGDAGYVKTTLGVTVTIHQEGK